jgi:hypothetical protein
VPLYIHALAVTYACCGGYVCHVLMLSVCR